MFKKSDYGYSSSHESLKSTKAVSVPNFDNKFSNNGKDFFDSVTEFFHLFNKWCHFELLIPPLYILCFLKSLKFLLTTMKCNTVKHSFSLFLFCSIKVQMQEVNEVVIKSAG